MRLTDAKIKRIKPPKKGKVKYADREGLYLEISASGHKAFRYNYVYAGKQRTVTYGAYPSLSLANARIAHQQAKADLLSGSDPSREKIRRRAEVIDRNKNSFSYWSNEWLSKREKEGLAELTLKKDRRFVLLLNADLGHIPISEITHKEMLIPIRKQEELEQYETARRLRAKATLIFQMAIASGINCLNIAREVDKAMVSRPRVKGFPFITDKKRLGQILYLTERAECLPQIRVALTILPHLFVRPSELRKSKWEEFDFEKRVWTIPQARMKSRTGDHFVPLSQFVIDQLLALREISGPSEYVFQGAISSRQPISENTLNVTLRRIGVNKEELVAHGYRKVASTLLHESQKFSIDAIETQLAHQIHGVRGIYNKAEYLDERINMMNFWSSYLLDLRDSHSRLYAQAA